MRRIDPSEAQLQILAENHNRCILESNTKAFLTLTQGVLGPLLLSNVPRNHRGAYKGTVFPPHRGNCDGKVDGMTILVNARSFKTDMLAAPHSHEVLGMFLEVTWG